MELDEAAYAGTQRGYQLFHNQRSRIWTALTPFTKAPISGDYVEVIDAVNRRVARTPHARMGSHRGFVLYERDDGVVEAHDEYRNLWLSSASVVHLRWMVDRYIDHGRIETR